MRRAVALFVTLGILMLISFMIMRSFDLVNRGFKHISNFEKINQTKVVIKDIQQVLGTITKNIKDPEVLNMILGAYPPISDENGEFTLSFELYSDCKAININTIIQEQNRSKPDFVPELRDKFIPIFNYIFDKYRVKDGRLLLNYILDTLDTDVVEREMDTELILKDVAFLNGLIVSREQFDKIIDAYKIRVEDTEVDKIPWEHFFQFSYNKNSCIVDCDFMSRELAEALQLEIYQSGESTEISLDGVDNSEIQCSMIESEENSETLNNFQIREFNKTIGYNLKGILSYSTSSVEDGFSFTFDLKNKRINNIEIQEVSTEN